MGTDVHTVFQARRDGKWIDIESTYEEDRDYMLFAWLANVRNGRGFAGIPTHTKVVPIAPSRGFPHDFVVDIVDDEGHDFRGHNGKYMGYHDFTWVRADEILDAKPPVVLRTAYVDIATYRAWDGRSGPREYCGDVAGRMVVKAESPGEITPATTHVRIEWLDDASESLRYFLDEVRRLKQEHGDVRIVMGFDS